MFRTSLLAAVAALLVHLSLGMPVAFAASATEAQNPDLTVSLTVPDQAAMGDTVEATISITNNSPQLQSFVVKGIWMDPAGEATVQTKNGLLLPGQTVSRVVDYTLNEKSIPGTHEITLSVEGKGGMSSATAAVQVI